MESKAGAQKEAVKALSRAFSEVDQISLDEELVAKVLACIPDTLNSRPDDNASSTVERVVAAGLFHPLM